MALFFKNELFGDPEKNPKKGLYKQDYDLYPLLNEAIDKYGKVLAERAQDPEYKNKHPKMI